jgi:hypothetical protein
MQNKEFVPLPLCDPLWGLFFQLRLNPFLSPRGWMLYFDGVCQGFIKQKENKKRPKIGKKIKLQKNVVVKKNKRITSALCGIFLCFGDFARCLDFENLQAKDDHKV